VEFFLFFLHVCFAAVWRAIKVWKCGLRFFFYNPYAIRMFLLRPWVWVQALIVHRWSKLLTWVSQCIYIWVSFVGVCVFVWSAFYWVSRSKVLSVVVPCFILWDLGHVTSVAIWEESYTFCLLISGGIRGRILLREVECNTLNIVIVLEV